MLAMPGHTSFSTGASAHNNNHCMSTYFILMIQCRVCAIQLHVSILTSRKLSVCVGGGGGVANTGYLCVIHGNLFTKAVKGHCIPCVIILTREKIKFSPMRGGAKIISL